MLEGSMLRLAVMERYLHETDKYRDFVSWVDALEFEVLTVIIRDYDTDDPGVYKYELLVKPGTTRREIFTYLLSMLRDQLTEYIVIGNVLSAASWTYDRIDFQSRSPLLGVVACPWYDAESAVEYETLVEEYLDAVEPYEC